MGGERLSSGYTYLLKQDLNKDVVAGDKLVVLVNGVARQRRSPLGHEGLQKREDLLLHLRLGELRGANLVDEAGARNRWSAGVDGALDAVFARPGDHLFGLIPGFDRTQADLTQQSDAGSGEFLEVVFGHAFFNDRRTGQYLDPAGAEIGKGTLRGDGQGLEAHDVFGSAGQMNLSGRNHGGDTPVHGRVDPAQLVLARGPVAKHRVHMAVDQPGRHGVDANLQRRQLDRQLAGEGDDGPLRRRVGGVLGAADDQVAVGRPAVGRLALGGEGQEREGKEIFGRYRAHRRRL